MPDDELTEIWPGPNDTLEPKWWLNREQDMDDIYERAGESLQKMVDKLEMYPFQDNDGNPQLFLARYEIPKYQASFSHPDAIFIGGTALIFIDFLTGFPIECVEMLGTMGEYSTQPNDYKVKQAKEGNAVAPSPDTFFEGIPEERLLLTKCFLGKKNQGKVLDEQSGLVALKGEPKPQKLHWWARANIGEDAKTKFPIPGEFMGLAVRMMPDMPWGKQRSSPFIFSGNWMDTVYLTSARIKAVIAPDAAHPYKRYTVQWRKDEVEATPSDFAEYKVDDRVTILKAVDIEKQSQEWKDDDVKEFQADKWIIVPITFYNDLGKE